MKTVTDNLAFSIDAVTGGRIDCPQPDQRSDDVDEKLCKKCGQTKPIDEFYRDAGAADGRQYWCRPCMSVAVRRSRDRNRERNLARRAAAKAGGAE
jgi:hypothetical protein